MSSFSSMCVTPAPSSLTAVPSDVNGSAPRSKSVLNTTNSCVVGPALVMLNFTLRVDAVPGVTAMPKSFSATSTVVSSESDVDGPADGSAVLSLQPDDTKPIVRTTNNSKTFLIPASSRQLPRQCVPRMGLRALARALDQRFEVDETLPQTPLDRRAHNAPGQLAHPAEGQLETLAPFHAGPGDADPRRAVADVLREHAGKDRADQRADITRDAVAGHRDRALFRRRDVGDDRRGSRSRVAVRESQQRHPSDERDRPAEETKTDRCDDARCERRRKHEFPSASVAQRARVPDDEHPCRGLHEERDAAARL